jgi:hypothetical protein
MSAHRLKADLGLSPADPAKRLQRVCNNAGSDHVNGPEIGGVGGIRTHGADIPHNGFRVLRFSAGLCCLVAKRVLWFGISDPIILFCDALCHGVLRSWFAIWFANSRHSSALKCDRHTMGRQQRDLRLDLDHSAGVHRPTPASGRRRGECNPQRSGCCGRAGTARQPGLGTNQVRKPSNHQRRGSYAHDLHFR